ncbi:MAG TPA: FAD-binding oxidoreductase [Chloroflexota bacterium]|nr:FAD-binding oxidoreductase [Chloroflexota bacterium]
MSTMVRDRPSLESAHTRALPAPSPLLYLTDPPPTVDLVIIGGGIVGAATAFHAARAGLRPLIVERRPALCSLTTAVATGGYRLQFDNPVELALVRQTMDLLNNFEEVTGQHHYTPQVRPQGYLWLTANERVAARQRDLVARQHGWGQTDIELLSQDELRYRFPFLSGTALQARFRQGDGFLNPRQVAMGLMTGARARVVVDCGVLGFQITDGRLAGVETSRGVISTRHAVIACGPLSGMLAASAGIDLPITTIRRQKVILPEARIVPPETPMVIDEDTGVHWRPAMQGAYLLFSDPRTPPSPPTEQVPTDDSMVFQLLNPNSPLALARLAPFWRRLWEHNTVSWCMQAGQYTMTPDHLPLIGPSSIEGLWVHTGYNGHGVMLSPAAAKLLIDALIGVITPSDNPFRLDRVFADREHVSL